MKRITCFILATALALGGLGAANAHDGIDVKVKGEWDFAFGFSQGGKGFYKNDERKNDTFIAKQRARTQINFIASENLQGVLMFEVGETSWGHNTKDNTGGDTGGKIAADGVTTKTKTAFIDWIVPDTALSIRIGLQNFALPSATGLGNPVQNEDITGAVASYKFDDNFSLTGFWLRPYDRYLNDREAKQGKNKHFNDEMDVFGLVAPMSFEDISVTPWFAWANVGSASGYYQAYGAAPENIRDRENKSVGAWWLGTSLSVDIIDPLTFAVDAMYGHLGRKTIGREIDPTTGALGKRVSSGASGWFVSATLDYQLDWATPGLFGWWSSGDSARSLNAGKTGRMPTVALSGFAPTSYGFDGGFGITANSAAAHTGVGSWGIGVRLADMSFIEDLTHTLRFAYYAGTNDHKLLNKLNYNRDDLVTYGENTYLTDKDSVFEINFDHKYQIYENLVGILQLGYIRVDLDKKTWENRGGYETDHGYNAQLSFQYKF